MTVRTHGAVAGSMRETIEKLRGTVAAMDIEAHADRDEIRRLRQRVEELGREIERRGSENERLMDDVQSLGKLWHEAERRAEAAEAELTEAIPEDVMMRSQEIAAENQALRAKLAEAHAIDLMEALKISLVKQERDNLKAKLAEANAEGSGYRARLAQAEAEVERLREALASYDSLSLVIETAVREMRDRDSREACNYEALLRTIDRARAALRGGGE